MNHDDPYRSYYKRDKDEVGIINYSIILDNKPY